MATSTGAPAAAYTHAAFSSRELPPLLICFGLLSALHFPGAWREGRFFDEEANVFFAYAWHFSAWDALFRPFAGYLNLAANALTLVLARAVQGGVIDLEHAPYFTMLLGLAFQLVPVALLLSCKAPWLRSRLMRLLGALFIVIAPGTEEVFANVIHIQFQLALSVALILASDVPQSRRARICYAAILITAPLCGPAAILLLPLFALRALFEHDKERFRQSCWLGTAALIQMAFFYGDSPIRGIRPDLPTAAAGTLLRLVLLPLFGKGLADQAAMRLVASQEHSMTVTLAVAAGSLLLFGALLTSSLRRRSSSIWLLVASLTIAIPCFTLGLAAAYRTYVLFPSAGSRYNLVPLVLLVLAIMTMLSEAKGAKRTILLAAACMGFTTAAAAFVRPEQSFNHGPSWREQVALWQADSNHQLRVWSSDRLLDLSGKGRPCRPPVHAKGDFDAPHYCEAGWMTDFWPDQTRLPHEKKSRFSSNRS